jgi:hypothetical protein
MTTPLHVSPRRLECKAECLHTPSATVVTCGVKLWSGERWQGTYGLRHANGCTTIRASKNRRQRHVSTTAGRVLPNCIQLAQKWIKIMFICTLRQQVNGTASTNATLRNSVYHANAGLPLKAAMPLHVLQHARAPHHATCAAGMNACAQGEQSLCFL